MITDSKVDVPGHFRPESLLFSGLGYPYIWILFEVPSTVESPNKLS